MKSTLRQSTEERIIEANSNDQLGFTVNFMDGKLIIILKVAK